MADEADIGEKERIQILLAEYGVLRSETNARISSMYVVGGWTVVAIIWLLQQPFSLSFWAGLIVWAIGTGYSARVRAYDTANAARRVREIEKEVNRRVGEKLLVWESERGGLNRSYWLRLFFLKHNGNSN